MDSSPQSCESSHTESDTDSPQPSDAGSFCDLEAKVVAKPPGHAAAAEIAKATAKADAETQGSATRTASMFMAIYSPVLQ